jgi:hypothetical protein
MGRRKTACVVQLPSEDSYESRSSTNLCSREFLQQKFNQAALERRPTTLYEGTTLYHIDRIKGLFTE